MDNSNEMIYQERRSHRPQRSSTFQSRHNQPHQNTTTITTQTINNSQYQSFYTQSNWPEYRSNQISEINQSSKRKDHQKNIESYHLYEKKSEIPEQKNYEQNHSRINPLQQHQQQQYQQQEETNNKSYNNKERKNEKNSRIPQLKTNEQYYRPEQKYSDCYPEDHSTVQKYYHPPSKQNRIQQQKSYNNKRALLQDQGCQPSPTHGARFSQPELSKMPNNREPNMDRLRKGRETQQQNTFESHFKEKIQEFAEDQNKLNLLLNLCKQIHASSPFYQSLLQTLQCHFGDVEYETEVMTDQQKSKFYIRILLQEKQTVQNSNINSRMRIRLEGKHKSIYNMLVQKIAKKITQMDDFPNKYEDYENQLEDQETKEQINPSTENKKPKFIGYLNPQNIKRSLQTTKKVIKNAQIGINITKALKKCKGKGYVEKMTILGPKALQLVQNLRESFSNQLQQASQFTFRDQYQYPSMIQQRKSYQKTSEQKQNHHTESKPQNWNWKRKFQQRCYNDRESRPQQWKRYQKTQPFEPQPIQTSIQTSLTNGRKQFANGIKKTYQALFPNFSKFMKAKYSK